MLVMKKIVDDLISTGISNIEQIFETDLLEELHKEILKYDQENDLQNAKIGRLKNHVLAQKIRRDKIKWLDGNTSAQKSFFEKLEYMRVELNKSLMLGLFDIEAHFAVYKKGDFYKKHHDSFKGNENRIISLVIYLNKNWQENDGGVLNIYKNLDDDKAISSVSPKWGKAILFLSEEVPHEVTMSNKTRYSIAAWFRVRQTLFPNIDSIK